MPACPSCNREIAEAARFCPECGAALPSAPAAAPPGAPAAPLSAPGVPPTVERETVPAAEPPSSKPGSSSSVHGRFDPGTRLGTRYRVVGLLGRGGMGEVYRADDLELGQSVALKFLPERVARSAADLARLRSEVRTARQIAHPNVCRTYDIAESDGHVFVVMEYIDGEDLASVLRRLGRPSPDKALEIARQLCLGLGAAHENGVLHRDLKPANIMIDGRGRVRITDFGLAGTAEEIAAEGGIAGTPAYMAPEQLRSGTSSPQSDIYSLGLVLYEVFTGKRASDMTPRPDPARPGSDSSVRTPSSLVADIDPAVERVILRCLERDPARRPQSAYAVYGALPGGDPLAAAVAAGETPSPELVANAGVEGSVRPLLAGIAVAAAVLGLAALSLVQQPLFRGLDRSSEYLSVRAEEILAQTTGKALPHFTNQGFRYAPAPKDSSARADSKPRAAGRGKLKPERAKQFWRRWSPEPLVTNDLHEPGSSISDPPQAYPGSATLVLDTRGSLLALAIEPEPMRDSSATHAIDWAGLLRAAGRDPSKISPTAPPAAFVSAGDTVAAWRVSRSGGAETTFVAAALRGRIIQADTYAGQTALGDLAVRTDPLKVTVLYWLALLFYTVVPLVGGIILARRNLKSGRGDVRGALLVGGTIAILYLVEDLFTVHVGELGAFRVLMSLTAQTPLGHALLHGVIMAIAYLAIEPYARRLWPSVLVGWARLVAGRVRDPIVGRDLLVGAAWGVGAQLLDVFRQHLGRLLSLTTEPVSLPLTTLRTTLDPQAVIAVYAHDLAIGFLLAVTMFTELVVLRFLLRNSRAAVVATVLALTLFQIDFAQGTAWLDAAVILLTMGIGVVVALRYGLVAVITALFVGGLATDLPWSADLGAWYAPQSLLGWALVAVILAYGFFTSTHGRSLFRDPLSDPVPGGPRPAA